ncbi:MAG: insulinase family protein [Cellvibrionales bacterium]|nr:insulinase family protein [Cellvibrionales bacterium]
MSAVSHPAFELIRTQSIDTLNVEVQEFRHKKTGASHFHFAADNNENVFLVGLRTVPMDHKGVAHILEHTALCGSNKYNVRDPFFMMIRRSLNTFMNAFTSNDWTAYPFASQNKKDFNNLLSVYLDAVFFANLDELDFLQEGHRIEFETADDPTSDLVYKGVVFNEMKGAMSSINSSLWQMLCKYLFPSTTYHYNSGGDPQFITDLSYDELKAFYKDHYHPSNAMFMTYGDIPAIEHQAQFEEKALSQFEINEEVIAVGKEKRYLSPLRVQEAYAFDSPEDPKEATNLNIGWLLGQNTSLTDVLQAQLLSYALLENSASPLQQYLESTHLGKAPSALCGLEDSYHELVFVCGLSGSKTESADQFISEVLGVLEKVADEGLPLERLEAIVHQLELSQREIGGDGYPYGLQMMLTALPCVTHRGDPMELLNLDPVLDKLREDIQDPNFIKDLVRKLLLDNPHRVELVATANNELSEKAAQAEKAELANIKNSLSIDEKNAIIEKAKALQARQQLVEDASVLPKVTLSDIKDDILVLDGSTLNEEPKLTHYQQGTNGLEYQQIVLPLPDLTDEEKQLLPLYCQCLTELGFNDTPYLEVQNRQSAEVGSIHAFTSIKSDTANEQHINGYLVLSSKALNRHATAMSSLLKDTLEKIVFTESQRIKELVSQIKQRKEQSVTGNGHMLAAATAASKMSGLAGLNHQLSGIPYLIYLKQLDQNLQDEHKLASLCETLAGIHKKIRLQPMQVLLINDSTDNDCDTQALVSQWEPTTTQPTQLQLPELRETIKQAWIANSQINFCAMAFPTVPLSHPDSPALTVLGGFLRNGFLHTAIREKGGAYGAGASQDSNLACFKFYSYRDPRIAGTLDDFSTSIDWVINNNHSPEQLEEAILGVIGSLDKPASPSGEAKHAFYNALFGMTPEKRRAFRHAILKVSLSDLQRVAKTYLIKDNASVGVITNESQKSEVEALGLHINVV